MRHFWILLFCLGCSTSSPNAWNREGGRLKVLCTTAMVGDLVKRVGGDQVEIAVLIQGEIDPHSYELVKGDGERLQRADLIFYNGLGLEHGASLSATLQESSHAHNLGATLPQEKLLYVGGALDPHIWMDVMLFSSLIDPIAAIFSISDPVHAEEYQMRASKAKADLQQLDEQLQAVLRAIPEEKRYLVTSHDAFNYFTRRYLATDEERQEGGWQVRFAAPEGLAPDGQLSSRHIKEIVDHLKAYRVKTLFPESNVSRDSIQKILSVCKSEGLEVKMAEEALYGDSMGKENYKEMMKHNAETIYQLSH